jgi:hypothetical protein
MEPRGYELVPSDAWLLLALIYAGGPVDRERIVAIGDGINHASFTDAELAGGMRRLIAAGHVLEQTGCYEPTPTVLAWHASISPPQARIDKDLERVERFLGLQRA